MPTWVKELFAYRLFQNHLKKNKKTFVLFYALGEAGTQFILAKCEDCHPSLFSNCLMASGRSPRQLTDSAMVWVCGRILFMFELWSKPRALEILNLFYFLSWIRYESACSVQILTAWLISEAKGYPYSLHFSPLVAFWFWFSVVTWGQILDQGNREPLIGCPKDWNFKDYIRVC